MKPKLSILIPSIRTNRLVKLYESAKLACKNYSFEFVLVGPFEPPQELEGEMNVKWIKDFGSPTRAVQIGGLYCSGDLIFCTVDDAVFYEDSIDKAISTYDNLCSKTDMINCMYSEGGSRMNPSYWNIGFDPAMKALGGAKPEWILAIQFMINKEFFLAIGGYDAEKWACQDAATKDLSLRVQNGGGKVYNSPDYVCCATWFEQCTNDHSVINSEQPKDWQSFYNIWRFPNDRYKIDYNNWEKTDPVWKPRFSKGISNSYRELIKNEEYNMTHPEYSNI